MRMYKGIDISLWDKNPDFNKVKNDGIDFVMIKASEGGSQTYPYPFKDPQFDKNIQSASKVKGEFYIGTYHFLTAQTVEEARREAEFFVKTINPYSDNIQLWCALDVEIPDKKVTANKKTFTALVKTFTDIVKEAGYRPIIYSQFWYIRAFFDVPENVPLWICDINTKTFPQGARMWQAGFGQVDGVDKEKVDIDYAYDIIGDANGDGLVNSKDVVMMMKHIVNNKQTVDIKQADIDRDGKITARDVVKLMKRIK